jgi:nucleotide-binding universal stress UspA family protein
MFERILLALDDSPAGDVATAFTGALARRAIVGAGARAGGGPTVSVHVLHVNERLVGGRGVTLHTRQEATDLVTGAVNQLAEAGVRAGGSVCVANFRGVPAQIVAVAAEREAGAIVLGSTRRRRLGRMFSAQVRERTTRLTSLPVLVAPAPLRVTPSLRGGELWAGSLDQMLESFFNRVN